MARSRQPRRPPAEDRADPSAELRTVVEMAELVAHEINNLLNNVLLHVAVLDRKGGEAIRAELNVIRQAGTRAGQLINRWQQIAPRRPADLQPLDLNRLVRETAAAWQAEPSAAVRLDLAPDLPPVLGDAADLERLLRLLLVNAAAAGGAGGLTVGTTAAPGEVLLRVDDPGPPIDPALVDRVFEPFLVARPLAGADLQPSLGLGLALCKKLARRQQGSVQAENRAEGGVRVTVRLRPAPAA